MTSRETHAGDLAELKFAYRAKQLGWNVILPTGSDSPYDLIIEASGDMRRIQVKSTQNKENGRDAYKLNVTFGGTNKVYTKKECDIIAAYVGEMDMFYIIPVEAVVSSTIRLYPHRPEVTDGYEPFIENWKDRPT